MKKNCIKNNESTEQYLDAAVSDLIMISTPFTEVFISRLTSGNFPVGQTSNRLTKVTVNRPASSDLPNPKEIQRAFLVHIVRRISTDLNNTKLRDQLKDSVVHSLTMRQVIREAMASLMTDTTMHLVSHLIADAVFKYKNGKDILDLQKIKEKLERYGWEKEVTGANFDLRKKHLSKIFADDPETIPILQQLLESTDNFDKRLRKCIDEATRAMIDKAFIPEIENSQAIISFRKFGKDDFIFLGKDCSLDFMPE